MFAWRTEEGVDIIYGNESTSLPCRVITHSVTFMAAVIFVHLR